MLDTARVRVRRGGSVHRRSRQELGAGMYIDTLQAHIHPCDWLWAVGCGDGWAQTPAGQWLDI